MASTVPGIHHFEINKFATWSNARPSHATGFTNTWHGIVSGIVLYSQCWIWPKARCQRERLDAHKDNNVNTAWCLQRISKIIVPRMLRGTIRLGAEREFEPRNRGSRQDLSSGKLQVNTEKPATRSFNVIHSCPKPCWQLAFVSWKSGQLSNFDASLSHSPELSRCPQISARRRATT